MKKSFVGLMSLAATVAVGTNSAQADALSSAENALRETKPIVDMRLRSESVDQDGLGEDASAITLRSRVGFETGKAWDTALLVEAELIEPLNGDYNSTLNGKTRFPVVNDPETQEINRAQLLNTSIPDTTVVLGRQRLTLDDSRFIASPTWRQNEQTFDALRITNKSIHDVTLELGYISQVNRSSGKDSPVGRYEGDSYFANAGFQTPFGKLTGFTYLLDFEQARTDTAQTAGVRFAGERPVSKVKVAYAVSYASQSDRAANPLNYSNDYYAYELGGTFRKVSLSAGSEVLEGNGVKGFSTPIGSLHKFQGWADKFQTTPPNGMDDRYVTLGYSTKSAGYFDSLSTTVSGHVYESTRLGLNYGSEINFQLQAKWQRFTGLVKWADYNADELATDTSKLWAQIEFVW